MGGKSDSKSTSTTDNSSSTVSSDGVVTGKVFQVNAGQNFNYTEELPAAVSDLMKQLVTAATGAGELAAKAYDKALSSTQDFANKNLTATQGFATQSVQPDLSIVKDVSTGFQQYIPMIVIGSLIAVVLIVRFKK